MLRRAAFFTLVALGSLSLAGGCSGSTTDGGGSTPVPADQFVTRFIDAVCNNIGSCCQQSGFAYDAAGCKALGQAEFKQPVSESPSVVYDPNAAGDCIAAVQKAATSCGAFDFDSSACEAILKGTLQAGAVCASSEECADPAGGNAYCDVPLDATSGKCVVETRGKSGESCGSTCTDHGDGSSDCMGSTQWTGQASCYVNDGLYCNGTCQPVIPVGQPCEVDGCAMGAYCQAGTCTAFPSAGEPCADGYLCGDASYCDPGGTCQSEKAKGQSCASDEECSTHRCDAGLCSTDTIVSKELCSGTK